MASIIQVRKDTAANWTSVNPILANGEIGFETDTTSMKIGNGVSNWNALSYVASAGTDGLDGNGWTGASYDVGTGVVTFTSDDGLGFSTGDLRGSDGADAVSSEGSGVTALDLTKIGGVYYDMASANSATSYTVTGTIAGGFCCVLINAATQPLVTAGTLIPASDFEANTDMHMWVQYFGTTIQYFFTEL